MDDWLQRYAEALGVAPLRDEEVALLLRLARDVAHGTERRFAPLSTYLAGVFVGSRPAADRGEATREAMTAAQGLLEADPGT